MNLHRLDLVPLSLFSLIARTGSMNRGAELGHLGVGAASKRISDLEDAVGADVIKSPAACRCAAASRSATRWRRCTERSAC